MQSSVSVAGSLPGGRLWQLMSKQMEMRTGREAQVNNIAAARFLETGAREFVDNQLAKRTRAVTLIQAHLRMYFARAAYATMVEEYQYEVIDTLCCYAKRYLAKHHLQYLRDNHHIWEREYYATRIQACLRGMMGRVLARQRVDELWEQDAATYIQAVARGHLARLYVAYRREQVQHLVHWEHKRDKMAVEIQRVARGFLGRRFAVNYIDNLAQLELTREDREFHAALVLQTLFKGAVARHKAKVMRDELFREKQKQRKEAASVLQGYVRRFLLLAPRPQPRPFIPKLVNIDKDVIKQQQAAAAAAAAGMRVRVNQTKPVTKPKPRVEDLVLPVKSSEPAVPLRNPNGMVVQPRAPAVDFGLGTFLPTKKNLLATLDDTADPTSTRDLSAPSSPANHSKDDRHRRHPQHHHRATTSSSSLPQHSKHPQHRAATSHTPQPHANTAAPPPPPPQQHGSHAHTHCHDDEHDEYDEDGSGSSDGQLTPCPTPRSIGTAGSQSGPFFFKNHAWEPLFTQSQQQKAEVYEEPAAPRRRKKIQLSSLVGEGALRKPVVSKNHREAVTAPIRHRPDVATPLFRGLQSAAVDGGQITRTSLQSRTTLHTRAGLKTRANMMADHMFRPPSTFHTSFKQHALDDSDDFDEDDDEYATIPPVARSRSRALRAAAANTRERDGGFRGGGGGGGGDARTGGGGGGSAGGGVRRRKTSDDILGSLPPMTPLDNFAAVMKPRRAVEPLPEFARNPDAARRIGIPRHKAPARNGRVSV